MLPSDEIRSLSFQVAATLRLRARQLRNERVVPHPIQSRLSSEALRFKSYLSDHLQDEARSQIPVDCLHERAAAALDKATPSTTKDNILEPLTYQEHLMVALLTWYKTEYMSWVNNMHCSSCGDPSTVSAGMGTPTADESAHGASRVELYRCQTCQAISRFPRYNSPAKLMQTRQGRCGEWANLFTLFSLAMGFETRYVMDYTDHVWCEFYSDAWGRWVHVDPSEGGGALDTPLMYETGWNKKLDYVFAIEEVQVVDVIRRYTRNLDQVLKRRKLARETTVETWIIQINKHLQKQLQASTSAIASLESRNLTEQSELLYPPNRPIRESEKVGRQSGNLDWRLARGEASLISNTPNPPPPSIPAATPILTLSSLHTRVGSTITTKTSIQLTPPTPNSRGAIWFPLPNPLPPTLLIRFSFRAGTPTHTGADGLALVLQSSAPTALGTGGSGLGYAGIPSSLALEFDTYASHDTCADPSDNHVSIHTRGVLPNSAHHRFSRACSSLVPVLNARWVHVLVRVSCREGAGSGMDVWMSDNNEESGVADGAGDFMFVLHGDVDVVGERVISSSGEGSWVGFTGATGGLFQVHEVKEFAVYPLE